MITVTFCCFRGRLTTSFATRFRASSFPSDWELGARATQRVATAFVLELLSVSMQLVSEFSCLYESQTLLGDPQATVVRRQRCF